MKKFLISTSIIFIFFSLFLGISLFQFNLNLNPSPTKAMASNDNLNVNLIVSGCNFNGICESGFENTTNCPDDCQSNPTIGTIPPKTGFFQNLFVTTYQDRAIITWQSSVPTLSILKWGPSQEHATGSLQSFIFIKNHSVEISNLTPNKIYYFNIFAQDILGRNATYQNGRFLTIPLVIPTSPTDPSSFSAFSNVSGINLFWKNPVDSNFDYVRLVRNKDKYFNHPYIGKVIYEGRAENFLDENVTPGAKYFYELYARNKEGKFSKPASLTIVHDKTNVEIKLPPGVGEIIPSKEEETLSVETGEKTESGKNTKGEKIKEGLSYCAFNQYVSPFSILIIKIISFIKFIYTYIFHSLAYFFSVLLYLFDWFIIIFYVTFIVFIIII